MASPAASRIILHASEKHGCYSVQVFTCGLRLPNAVQADRISVSMLDGEWIGQNPT